MRVYQQSSNPRFLFKFNPSSVSHVDFAAPCRAEDQTDAPTPRRLSSEQVRGSDTSGKDSTFKNFRIHEYYDLFDHMLGNPAYDCPAYDIIGWVKSKVAQVLLNSAFGNTWR